MNVEEKVIVSGTALSEEESASKSCDPAKKCPASIDKNVLAIKYLCSYLLGLALITETLQLMVHE